MTQDTAQELESALDKAITDEALTEVTYTYAGRYFENSRNYNHFWTFGEIMKQFGSGIKKVLSLGCSNGINEAIIAARYPQLSVTAIDLSPAQIEKAVSGVWKFEEVFFVRDEIYIPLDLNAYRRFVQYCPREYFQLDMRENVLRRRKDILNVHYEHMDARNLAFGSDSFDIVIMHMLGGAFYGGKYAVKIGNEVSRVLRNEGLFSSCFGIHTLLKSSERQGYYQIVKKEDSFTKVAEPTPTDSPLLFPSTVYLI